MKDIYIKQTSDGVWHYMRVWTAYDCEKDGVDHIILHQPVEYQTKDVKAMQDYVKVRVQARMNEGWNYYFYNDVDMSEDYEAFLKR